MEELERLMERCERTLSRLDELIERIRAVEARQNKKGVLTTHH